MPRFGLTIPAIRPGRSWPEEEAPADPWHVLAVDLSTETDIELRLRKLRRLAIWLAEHHRPARLFHADGRPTTDTVCLAVRPDQAGKALAFRALCHELELSAGLSQWRVLDAQAL